MQTLTDLELIHRAQKGDGTILEKLYERYRVSIFRYFYYRVEDPHTADDLTSEVFLRLIRALPNYQERGVAFEAWLFQIAHHLIVDHHRKHNHHSPATLEENLTSQEQDMDTALDHNLNSQHLQRALSTLDEHQRDVIVLRFVAGMPIAQVAQTLHKSEDAIKALQRRGLASLRKTLADLEVSYV